MSTLSLHEQAAIRAGSTFWFGTLCQQNPNVLVSINRLLNAHSFDTIIELGTCAGGLSLPLALYCCMSAHKLVSSDPNDASHFVNLSHHKQPRRFFTFDNVERDRAVHTLLRELGAFPFIQDTLDEANADGIRSLIKNGKSILLLCDGGNKKRELDLYGGSLKSGDFIMLHDWAYDEVTFERNKREGIWRSWEVRMEDGEGEGQQFGVDKLLERHDIEPIYADEFDKVAWLCGRKR